MILYASDTWTAPFEWERANRICMNNNRKKHTHTLAHKPNNNIIRNLNSLASNKKPPFQRCRNNNQGSVVIYQSICSVVGRWCFTSIYFFFVNIIMKSNRKTCWELINSIKCVRFSGAREKKDWLHPQKDTK